MLEITNYLEEPHQVRIEITYLDANGWAKTFTISKPTKIEAMTCFCSNLHSYILLMLDNLNQLASECKSQKIEIHHAHKLDVGTLVGRLEPVIKMYQIKKQPGRETRLFRLYKDALVFGIKNMKEILRKIQTERDLLTKNEAA